MGLTDFLLIVVILMLLVFGVALKRMRNSIRAVQSEQAAYSQALGRALGELANEQHRSLPAVEAALGDLQSSSSLLVNHLTALAAELAVKYGPSDIDIGALDNYDVLDQNWQSFGDGSGRLIVSCALDETTAVIVTLGQSNAANHATTAYVPKHEVLNFNLYDGNCYRAEDPLLGASGRGGNFATPLADMLIERGLYDRVIVAPIGMGGSTVEKWAAEGVFNRRILVLIRRLHDARLTPTHILWHQGEGESGEGDERGRLYRKNLLEVIATFRRYGIDAPFFVALATKCGGYPRPGGHNIREGQRSTVNRLMRVFLGPDTDTLGDEYRDAEHCHFNGEGLLRHAGLWADVLDAYARDVSGRPDLRRASK